MTLPVQFKNRKALNPRLGIKSSFSGIRNAVALLYLIFNAERHQGRRTSTIYSEDNGSGGIMLKKELLDSIQTYLEDSRVSSLIESSSLLTSQLEHIQVFAELLLALGRVSFVSDTGSSAERTGGKRLPKQIQFATNIIILDNLLSSFPEQEVKSFLITWLQNQVSANTVLESKVCELLTIFTERCILKYRFKAQNDLLFQPEGIYLALADSPYGSVSESDAERVGTYRIFKNFISEGLHSILSFSSGTIRIKSQATDLFNEYYPMVSTTLDLTESRNLIDDTIENSLFDHEIDTNEDVEDISNPKTTPEPQISSYLPGMQLILFGAPGTGKSNKLRHGLNINDGDFLRTTFHPDTDYASFVGCYKPRKDETTGSLTYDFTGQVFIKAYVAAWKLMDAAISDNLEPKQFTLVIEEINRGNCSQIFGDLFQLLDRNENGYSDYGISPDADLQSYLNKELSGCRNIPEKIQTGHEMILPPNLTMVVTMNTSDQSLFPIDSAFKRRWEWEYLPIKDEGKDHTVRVGDYTFKWWPFIETVNHDIQDRTNSEDKKLGYWFTVPRRGTEIDEKLFVSKVIFYLWNDIYKDFLEEDTIFSLPDPGSSDNGKPSFTQFFKNDAIDSAKVIAFVRKVFGSKADALITGPKPAAE